MKLSFETARQVAEHEIHQRIAASAIFSRYQFTPVILEEENERFWIFVSGSERLFDDGVTPDAIYVCVDKDDGHLWSREEEERFYAQQAAAPDSQQPASRVA